MFNFLKNNSTYLYGELHKFIRTEERQSHQEKAAAIHLSLVLQQFEARQLKIK